MQILFLIQLERIILFSHLTSLLAEVVFLSDSTIIDIVIDLGGPVCLTVGLSGLNYLWQLPDSLLVVAHCTPDSIPHQLVYCIIV